MYRTDKIIYVFKHNFYFMDVWVFSGFVLVGIFCFVLLLKKNPTQKPQNHKPKQKEQKKTPQTNIPLFAFKFHLEAEAIFFKIEWKQSKLNLLHLKLCSIHNKHVFGEKFDQYIKTQSYSFWCDRENEISRSLLILGPGIQPQGSSVAREDIAIGTKEFFLFTCKYFQAM